MEDHDDQDGNGASGPPGGNNPGSGSGKNVDLFAFTYIVFQLTIRWKK